jgi:hypothetical protein
MAQVNSETSTAVPGESPGPLYIPTDVTPEQLFQAIGKLRKEARDEIDRLIRFLDDTDNHMEREEAVDDVGCDDTEGEPSLGWTEQEARWGKHAWSADIDAELDRADYEPALASPENHPGSQDHWAAGSRDDRESDPGHDDREPDVDDEDGGDKEPAFGWSDEEAARGSYPSIMGARAEHEGNL